MAAGSVHGAAGLSFAEQEAAGGGGGRAAKGMRRPRGWTAVAFIIGLHLSALLNLKHMHVSEVHLLLLFSRFLHRIPTDKGLGWCLKN
jgi:hypothetical protein